MHKQNSTNIITIGTVLVLVVLLIYLAYLKTESLKSPSIETPTPTQLPGIPTSIPSSGTSVQSIKEQAVIEQLLASWKVTQSKFAVKAGESGTYNAPGKIQFISEDTMLVHYDDGLVDHISILKLANNSFTELKNVGIMSTMSMRDWQSLVKTYGKMNYAFTTYASDDYQTYSQVYQNLFVK